MNKRLFKVRFFGDNLYYFAENKKEVQLYILETEDITVEEFEEDYRITEINVTEL